jgi:CO/xanthine dehydrogenase FAD-binding subunit
MLIVTVLTPTSVAEVLDGLGRFPTAVLIAGGTDLMVELNSGHRSAEHLISLDRIAELRRVQRLDGDRLFIGSGVPYHELMTGEVARLVPALSEAARTVGSPQIRRTGTLGGNLGTCSPAGDGLPVLAALSATVHLRSTVGERRLSFAEYMVGPKRSVRTPDEVILGVDVPIIDGWQGYSKVGVRNAMVIATASSCLVADTARRTISVALGSVGPVILGCDEASEWVATRVDWAGAAVEADVVTEFGSRCAGASRPIDDHRSTAAYRRHAISILTSRQLRRAFPNG